jgi:hypothetical protein
MFPQNRSKLYMPHKSGITIKAALMLCVCVQFAFAQQKPAQAQLAIAPIPSQILNAKKIFVSNGVGDVDISPDHISGTPDRAYNGFYAGLKDWGRYELEATPADAELLFEIYFTAPMSYATGIGNTAPRAQFKLVIRDVKTGALLWTFVEYLDRQKVAGKWSHDKAFDQTILALVADVKKLATPVGASIKN